MKKFLLICIFISIYFPATAQENNPLILKNDFQNQRNWVDSIYSNMTLEEKIGQLFMADIFSSDPKAKTDKIKDLITNYHLGGVIFSKGGPVRQAKLNNEFQALAKVPLMIGMDAEWGLAMRLDSTYAFPWNMTLGAITDNKIVEKIGKRIGEQSKRLGVHINFAPVVDINTNPKNPIIGNRSFGEDRENVTQKALAFMKGMQSAGVLGSAKHFPGHGDTDADSHKTLPTIDFSRERLDTLELYPYKKLISEGLSSVMVAHLNVPALEPQMNYPSSLSSKVITDLLKKEMGFHGLIFTDALNMKGASNYKKPGEIELAAFLAGNDVLLISEDVPKAITFLINAYNEETLTEKRLAYSVKKILYAKYKVGLNYYKPVKMAYLGDDLNSVMDDALYEEAMDHALTVLKNNRAILPIKDLQKKKIAYINFGDDSGQIFLNELKKYGSVDWVVANSLDEYIQKLKEYNYVIIGFHKNNDNPWKPFQFTENELVWLYEIARTNTVILNVFARPYAMLDLKSTANFEGVIMSYQNSKISQQLSAQLIFGAREAKGKLPVSLGEDFPLNTFLQTKSLRRLQYGTPESVGVNSYKLRKIDSLAISGIKDGMYPGAQVLVARKGKIIYQKNFGHHEYDKQIAVRDSTVYDLASLTKILASLPIVMELVDKKELSLNTKLSEMLPEYRNSNKADVTLKQMLSHYARFKAWIPFYRYTFNDAKTGVSSEYYSDVPGKDFNVQVAENLYMRRDYIDTIYSEIRDSELNSKLEYKYSDLPYYILKEYLERKFGKPLELIVQENLYESLGANFTMYHPLEKFSKENIPPTEQDNLFRKQKVQGYVHDQGAAMLGGASGHAGLFSNSNDVAKIMQMFLWKGFYGGKRYFNPNIMDDFNNCYYCNKNVRRGVGFDKPQLGNSGPTCGCVSMSSFGHSGFTGTFAWADPEEEIVYVFLSNRTFPDAENRKLIRSDLRSKIQKAIYEAIDF
ncbi:glycoside hydrolase family 3 N-terminal domain-containing protein [Aequorivita sp. SDUM287046]|uniref:beta-N-acetylhexosaminidase n=1 Tax=Aequorivita aurantiaca TaxID=3053356 RepID=A0ABT8DEE8_9FLAO|nr:glycoside hydrolase family 3 N-terminal domain-containing protein [Aequorivita aurantiaca]MDN3723513.1 glycoside hydrolase family 3 N-terminal domain-containing protein [Aequorivita aurantiaca]